MTVVACISDLYFQSKVAETARHLQVDLTIAGSESKLDEVIREIPGSSFVVDLCFGNDQGVQAVTRIRRKLPEARLVAFAPHVEEDLLEGARQAGATDVMSRAKFTKLLPEILGAVAETATASSRACCPKEMELGTALPGLESRRSVWNDMECVKEDKLPACPDGLEGHLPPGAPRVDYRPDSNGARFFQGLGRVLHRFRQRTLEVRNSKFETS